MKWWKSAALIWKRQSEPLRGRVAKVSTLPGGEVSIVLRFGIDEFERARTITPQTVLEVVEVERTHPDAA